MTGRFQVTQMRMSCATQGGSFRVRPGAMSVFDPLIRWKWSEEVGRADTLPFLGDMMLYDVWVTLGLHDVIYCYMICFFGN